MPLAEITLRKYEKPYNLEGRELIKKVCLSLGLLQPGDSRDVIVDVLQVILDAKKEKKELDSETINKLIIENRKKHKLHLSGIAASNIRRQLKRLRNLFLIEKVANKYRVTENATLQEIFREKIEAFYLKSILDRVKEYLEALPK
ncbi:hypothetical protein J4457_07350 [Candidatus Woesearchaeota archaeon]|nr:hypothetical protein [Candidatus Woesearchaeota archaeon]